MLYFSVIYDKRAIGRFHLCRIIIVKWEEYCTRSFAIVTVLETPKQSTYEHFRSGMAILLSRKIDQGRSRKTDFGAKRSSNHFKFGPKSIFVFVTIVLLLYLLSFLKVAVRVHQLDHATNNLSVKNDWLEEKKNYRNGGNKINTEDSRASAIRQILREQETKPVPKKEGPEPPPRINRPHVQGNPHGYMVSPETIVEGTRDVEEKKRKNVPQDQILTAYLEFTDRSAWKTKPLPVRNVKAEDLIKTQFPKLTSCSKLPEQWPVDDYPDADPFLPWIHDVFPTDDGKYIQFVTQNRRRCHTGTTKDEKEILDHTSPQVALFQHVPLKKLKNSTDEETRYRLCSHEDADIIDTRFICRFKPSGDITFSEFNNDYEWTAHRKRQPVMFHEHGKDNYQIQTSQLLFRCPVPEALVSTVREGTSVIDDWATIFVDLIPVRTPPRYGAPNEFLVPYYAEAIAKKPDVPFDPHKEWGEEHILPRLDDSGRWANIPVCKPSLMTYEPEALKGPKRNEKKKHHLVSCLWASTGYSTRGNRYAINDGQRRLLEWLTFNKILGFDHFYLYDNSGAFTNQSSLKPIADLFPDDVTVIKWPSRVCNNNPNNVDSVGERSSQYAAESSCRLRFGPHVNWIGQFDIDEYLVPMGNFSSVLPLLEKLDDEGKKIISFASWRAWPRRTHIK